MKIKVSEATNIQLDWMVTSIEFRLAVEPVKEWVMERHTAGQYQHPYSTDWSQGGPIIEREAVAVSPVRPSDGYGWVARIWHGKPRMFNDFPVTYGPKPLIAAMRCYVASKLGDEAEVPDELTS